MPKPEQPPYVAKKSLSRRLIEVLETMGTEFHKVFPDITFMDDSERPDTMLDVHLVMRMMREEIERLRNGT